MRRFADFPRFVVKTLQPAIAEYEKSTFEGFIFGADSGSIRNNASHPGRVAVHATLKVRKIERMFDDALRDQARYLACSNFQIILISVTTLVGEINE